LSDLRVGSAVRNFCKHVSCQELVVDHNGKALRYSAKDQLNSA
jgi:hypothetical protein